MTESNHSSLSITGNISDDNNSESLTLNGDGTGRLVLSGTNSYGGGTVVLDGTLVATSAYALPTGTSLTVGSGGRAVRTARVRVSRRWRAKGPRTLFPNPPRSRS